MAITFAYELGKKCLIYQNVQREIPHPLAIGFTRLGFFLIFKIPKGTMKAGRFKQKNSKLFYFLFFLELIIDFCIKVWNSKNNIMCHRAVIFKFLPEIQIILIFLELIILIF